VREVVELVEEELLVVTEVRWGFPPELAEELETMLENWADHYKILCMVL
jgi:hypothetical protein